MRATTLLAAMSALHHVAATPVVVQRTEAKAAVPAASSAPPVNGGNGSLSQLATGADSCPAETLSADTWKKLDLDKFLAAWAKANVTKAQSNNVQALAQSFGAPNFFWYVWPIQPNHSTGVQPRYNHRDLMPSAKTPTCQQEEVKSS